MGFETVMNILKDRALKVAVRKFLGKGIDEDNATMDVLIAVRLNPDEVLGRYSY